MANFLDDLSVYNAKAALVISQVVANGDTGKANMMSSLKTTANDTTLSEAIRLNALTALINLGSLLDVPLPPYFPLTTTYADTQTYVGIHNDLTGIQGGAPGDYQHITTAERNLIANAATLGDISFTNLSGVYTDNANLVNAFAGKQNTLSGTGFVKISGTTISYDNSTYLTTISGIAAGGELSGTYPNPALSNAAVISKLLTGFTGVALPTPITSSDTILSAMQKLNNNISSLIVSPSGVASVRLTTNSGGVFTTTTTPQTGASTLDVSLNSQSASTFLASPTSAAGVPTFRAFAVTDLPNSGATAGTYGSSSFIPQIVVDAKGRITSISSVAAAAGGQVNTVTLTQPGIFTAATNIGTASAVNLNYGLSQQIANYVWAGPISGANATPTFRSLVAADIPNIAISQVTSLSSTLDGFLTDSLSDGSIWIGNTSNAAVQRVLSGDVTVSNTGVTAIGLAKVQYDMIQDVTTQTLLGRYDAVDGEVQQITLLGTDFVLNSGTGVLSLASPVAPVVSTKGDLLGHDLTTQQRVPSSNVDGDILLVNNSATGAYTDLGLNWVTMSGDATINATGAITIANAAVSLAKMANLPANRIIGNNTGSSATPLALTGTQVTAMLDLFSTSTGTKGLVPGSNGNTTYFLRGDLSWQPITGTGTVTAVSINTANGFAGTSSGGATPALTIELNSLNGVLKGTGTAIAAATAGTDFISPGQITQTSGAGSGLTMASGSLLGRTTASAGVIEAISVNSSLTLASTTLGLNLGNGNIFTVQQQMPSLRLNGATSGFVSFTPPAIAGAQVYELPAAVPSGSGQYLTATTGGVLSWSSPAGSGTTTNAATFNNSGSGDASGTTFNGSAARTISYNTLGAQQANTNLTGLSALTYASGTPFVKMTGAGTFSLDTNTYISGTTTQYSVLVGGAGNSIVSITPVVSNKLLISNGTTSNPGWTQATYLDTIVSGGILYGSGTDAVGQIVAPSVADTFLKWDGSTFTWAVGGGGGGGTTTNSLTINNSGAGNSSGITFNGSASVTISSNTILPSFTGNAGYALVVNGTSDNVQWSPVGNVTGAGNAGRVAYWDSGSSITGSADFFWDNSNKYLGVGTTTPECGLHVSTTGSQDIKGIMNMHYDNTASSQAKYIGARARGNNPNNPSALQTDDSITSLSGRGYKASTWSDTVGGYYIYASENWTNTATGTYLAFRGVVSGGTTVSEWARLTSSSTLVELALGQSSTKSGGLLLYSSGGAFTTRLQASPSASSSETYILPATDGTSGQLLSTDGNGVMSWITGIGSGDVVGPAGAADGDFAVFDGTTGKIIKESVAASLSAAGAAVFNTSLALGVSGPTGTTGQLIFRNATTSATTTFQSSTSQSANLIYTWPQIAPTAGQILSSDINGNLSWTAAGSGDMTLAGVQTVTGAKTFGSAGNVGKLILAGTTSGTTVLNSGAAAGSSVLTLPVATSTLACLGLAQTFTAAQTFQAGIALNTAGTFTTSSAVATTFSGTSTFSNTVTMNATGSNTVAQINLTPSSGNSNWIDFAIGAGGAAPSTVTRSTGSRIVFGKWVAANLLDTAMGYNAGELWFSTLDTTYNISFYAASGSGGTTIRYGRFNGNGLTLDAIPSATVSNLLVSAPSGTRGAWMNFGTIGAAAPTITTSRSEGTKIVLRPFFTSGSETDFAIGYNTGDVWLSTASTSYTISMYAGATRVAWFSGAANVGLTFADGYNIVFNATTGTKIATATTQKLAFWNKTPIVQPTTSITGATRVGGAGTTVTTTDTYGGYTLAQIAAALVNTGILA